MSMCAHVQVYRDIESGKMGKALLYGETHAIPSATHGFRHGFDEESKDKGLGFRVEEGSTWRQFYWMRFDSYEQSRSSSCFIFVSIHFIRVRGTVVTLSSKAITFLFLDNSYSYCCYQFSSVSSSKTIDAFYSVAAECMYTLHSFRFRDYFHCSACSYSHDHQ